jgi:putative membrane protein
MHFMDGGFWGMHVIWWVVWIALISIFFGLLTPVPRSKARVTPLHLLQRRYASGEISTEEYEERKTRIERDTPSSS